MSPERPLGSIEPDIIASLMSATNFEVRLLIQTDNRPENCDTVFLHWILNAIGNATKVRC
jgi:hypothetical protein